MVRLAVRWLLNGLALYAVAYLAEYLGILRGFHLDTESPETAFIAVAILALLNLTVRPLLKLLTLPISCLTFGLFTLVINALMMMLTAYLVIGFEVGSFWNALIASILFAFLSSVINSILNPEKD